MSLSAIGSTGTLWASNPSIIELDVSPILNSTQLHSEEKGTALIMAMLGEKIPFSDLPIHKVKGLFKAEEMEAPIMRTSSETHRYIYIRCWIDNKFECLTLKEEIDWSWRIDSEFCPFRAPRELFDMPFRARNVEIVYYTLANWIKKSREEGIIR